MTLEYPAERQETVLAALDHLKSAVDLLVGVLAADTSQPAPAGPSLQPKKGTELPAAAPEPAAAPPAPESPTTPEPAPAPSGDAFAIAWPCDSRVITQPFGARPEVYARWGLPGHEGIDIGARLNAPIYACAPGTVYQVFLDDGKHNYGNHVRISHELADGRVYKTIYAHLSYILVQVGQIIRQGQTIGLTGSTGNSTGPHLHLTLKKQGASAAGETSFPRDIIDPAPFLTRPTPRPAPSPPPTATPPTATPPTSPPPTSPPPTATPPTATPPTATPPTATPPTATDPDSPPQDRPQLPQPRTSCHSEPRPPAPDQPLSRKGAVNWRVPLAKRAAKNLATPPPRPLLFSILARLSAFASHLRTSAARP
jgi:murein DD-endopeptidase MepM/ murein hydrolase activator NlpD